MASHTLTMSVSEWIDVPDNPRQRNTEKRANYAVRYHLKEYSPLHRFVFAAILNDAVVCKLDGHTRALLWEKGMLQTPPEGTVVVNLIRVKSMTEAKHYYNQLDNSRACKRPSDEVYSACNENGFTLTSALLRSCQFKVGLQIAENGKKVEGEVFPLVKKWKSHLIALDKLSLTSNYTILIPVMLRSIARDGVEMAGPFWEKLDANAGTKTEKHKDAVQALYAMMEVRRSNGATSGYDNLIVIANKAWTCYAAYRVGKKFGANQGVTASKEFSNQREESEV
jgi:hypothetical protein